MKNLLTIISAGLLFLATSCSKTQDVQPASDQASATAERLSSISPTTTSTYPATIGVYYNNVLFKVEIKPYPIYFIQADPSIAALRTINTMYVIKENVPAGTASRFLPVVSALPRTSFSSAALWQEVVVTFTNETTKPSALFSADEILKLATMPNSTVTLTKTSAYFQMQLSKDQPMSTK